MSDNTLTEPFRKMAGDKANLIPNLQAAGQIIKAFIEFSAQESDITLHDFTYYDDFEEGLNDYVLIQFETRQDETTCETGIQIHASGIVEISNVFFDENGKEESKDDDARRIWVLAEPSTIAHQVIKYFIDDPQSILSFTQIDFETPYKKLMGELEEQPPQPPPVPEPPAAPAQPTPAKPAKKWGLF